MSTVASIFDESRASSATPAVVWTVLSVSVACAFERITLVAIWPLIACTVPPPLNEPPDASTVLVASAAI